MFLYQLNLMEKMAFAQLAKEMVMIDDGKIDALEYELLSTMSNEMQIAVDNVLSIEFNLEHLAGEFKSTQSKRICIIELFSLAMINREFHEKQKRLLDGLIIVFGIDCDEVDEMKSWVGEALDCSARGMELITGLEVGK